MPLEKILDHPRVQAARSLLREQDSETLEEQVRIAAIAAPTGAEAARGRHLETRFRALGLTYVQTDEVGNVLGFLPRPVASAEPPRPPIVVAAHLDTVFQEASSIRVHRDGPRILAPGITDNARGLAAILGMIRALCDSSVSTATPILFVATVGEEGAGDLLGVKHLFREASPFRTASAFIAVDGAGISRVVHRATGACRLRATVCGPGGHSWGDRGTPNPIHALGAAVAKLRDIVPTEEAEYGVTVARTEGGTSVNSIPARAWIEIDLRADRAAALGELEESARRILEEAVREEKRRATRPGSFALHLERTGSRPPGVTPVDEPLVQIMMEATRLVGAEPELASSSTDANVPISLGIPAVAIGAGGIGGGVHTTSEWYDNDGGVLGIERAMLALLGIAGLS